MAVQGFMSGINEPWMIGEPQIIVGAEIYNHSFDAIHTYTRFITINV